MGTEICFPNHQNLPVNAFVAWRMSRNEEMLRTKEDFGDLGHFRESMNRVQSLADFIFDVSRELLVYADSLARETTVIGEEQPQVTDGEAARLQGLARRRRGQRLKFFNNQEGVKLRLQVRPYQQRQTPGLLRYCCLCGSTSSSFRRRTTFRCLTCDVPLCDRTHAGRRKSCWSIWHEALCLKVREHESEGMENDENELRHQPNSAQVIQERGTIRRTLSFASDAQRPRTGQRSALTQYGDGCQTPLPGDVHCRRGTSPHGDMTISAPAQSEAVRETRSVATSRQEQFESQQAEPTRRSSRIAGQR